MLIHIVVWALCPCRFNGIQRNAAMSSTALHIVLIKYKSLLAVLLIGAVMHWHGLLTTKYK